MTDASWSQIDYLLTRKSDIQPDFEPDTPDAPNTKNLLKDTCHVLVIGAGGLGCEILKDLALSGFKHIDVLDMDTIDISNLNRQFLFRMKDVGRPKAEVAAEFINTRVQGVHVNLYDSLNQHRLTSSHYCDLTTKDTDFFAQFNIIIAGLDAIKPRRWINATLQSMVTVDDETGEVDGLIPLIDGGTEAFKGQVRVVLPTMTSCLECSLELFPADPLNFQLCTLAEKPRQPEHCIEYVHREWTRFWPDDKLDKDNGEHMNRIYVKALERAEQFNISGVTLKLTQGVVKRIIPAIAATNAIISAGCVLECLKIISGTAPYLNNYMMYNGTESIFTNTFDYAKSAKCPFCGTGVVKMKVEGSSTLNKLIDEMKSNPNMQLAAPSLRVNFGGESKSLYMRKPAQLEEATRPNLEKALIDLFPSGSQLIVSDPFVPGGLLRVEVDFM